MRSCPTSTAVRSKVDIGWEREGGQRSERAGEQRAERRKGRSEGKEGRRNEVDSSEELK
jgi:hypothetical protein